jgi:hypothetical protein
MPEDYEKVVVTDIKIPLRSMVILMITGTGHFDFVWIYCVWSHQCSYG